MWAAFKSLPDEVASTDTIQAPFKVACYLRANCQTPERRSSAMLLLMKLLHPARYELTTSRHSHSIVPGGLLVTS
mgnify:CR=1 FL=1